MKFCVEIVSAIFSAAAAILWFMSTLVEIPRDFPIEVISIHTDHSEVAGAQVISEGFGNSPELTKLGEALKTQSRLSAWAAGFAAAAAICQTAGALLPTHP